VVPTQAKKLGFSFKYSYVKDALKAIISWSNISTATVIFFILWNWIHASTFPTCQWQFINGFINIFNFRVFLWIDETKNTINQWKWRHLFSSVFSIYSGIDLCHSVTLVPSFYIGIATWTKVVYITARNKYSVFKL
jgi:hypothetical protein